MRHNNHQREVNWQAIKTIRERAIETLKNIGHCIILLFISYNNTRKIDFFFASALLIESRLFL